MASPNCEKTFSKTLSKADDDDVNQVPWDCGSSETRRLHSATASSRQVIQSTLWRVVATRRVIGFFNLPKLKPMDTQWRKSLVTASRNEGSSIVLCSACQSSQTRRASSGVTNVGASPATWAGVQFWLVAVIRSAASGNSSPRNIRSSDET